MMKTLIQWFSSLFRSASYYHYPLNSVPTFCSRSTYSERVLLKSFCSACIVSNNIAVCKCVFCICWLYYGYSIDHVIGFIVCCLYQLHLGVFDWSVVVRWRWMSIVHRYCRCDSSLYGFWQNVLKYLVQFISEYALNRFSILLIPAVWIRCKTLKPSGFCYWSILHYFLVHDL